MKIYKKVREIAQLSPWEMKTKMNKSIQNYQHLEKKGKYMSLADLVALREVYPGGLESFWDLIVEMAKRKP
jgi:hypothetical protein